MTAFLSTLWPANPVVRMLLLAMAALFLFSLALTWRAYRQLQQEQQAARQLLTKKNLSSDRLTLAVQLGPLASRFAGQLLTAMASQRGLAFARPADVLDPILESVQRVIAPTRSLPNLLLLSGLISTVVGLAFTLQSLGPQIQGAINSGDPATVARSLGLTLREMGGAFAGTLWGVTMAFLLQALNALTTLQAERLSGELDQVALLFAPEIYPASSEQQLASLRDLVQRSEEFLQVTQEKISETSEQFAEVLGQAGNVIQKSLETLQTTSADISKSLLQASGDVRQSSEQLSRAAGAIREHQQDFRNIYSSFNEMFERSMKALKGHADQELGEIRALQKEFGDTGVQIVQEIFRTSEKLGELRDDLAHLNTTFLAGTQEVNTSIRSGFDRLDTELGKTLGAYTAEVQAISSQLGTLGERLSQVHSASGALERTLRAKDDAEVTRQRDHLGSIQVLTAALTGVATRLEHLQGSLDGTQQNAIDTLSRLEALQANTAAALADGNRAAQRQLELWGQAVQEQLVQQGRGQQEQGAALHRQAVEANLLLTGVLDSLSRQAEQLSGQLEGWEQVRVILERQQAASEELHRLLAALPAQLHVRELEQHQQALVASLERLHSVLSVAMAPPLAEGPAA